MAAKPPDHVTLEHLRVEAFRPSLGETFLGGPVLKDPNLAQFRHKRDDRACDRFDEEAQFNRYLSGHWAYIGPKYSHFGHIMAEMIHRILPTKLFFPEANKYLIVTTGEDEEGPGFDALCRTYREVLEFYKIAADSVLILNENAVVEHLSLCEQGSNLGGRQMPWYLEALRDYSTQRLDEMYGSESQHPKVYVSKSRMPHGGKILGEQYIEELLTAEGFLVFHPEESSLSEQMDIYRKASDLVFEEGSACHGTELLGDKMMNRTVLIVRRMESRDGFASILKPRSKQFESFCDTYFLGTIIVNVQQRYLHSEFGVSLFDPGRLIDFFRDRQLATLDNIDLRRYFEAAEKDLRDYFNYHMHAGIEEVDPWRVSEVRLEFEKVRQRILVEQIQVPLDLTEQGEGGDADSIISLAWGVHRSGRWLEAVTTWEGYRERFPYGLEGFTHGAVALIELGRFYEADTLLRQAMELFPISEEVFSDYALVSHHRHDWREAVNRWELYRGKFPHDRMSYALGAVALCELERYADADVLVLSGLEVRPDDEELLEKHAWVAQLSKDLPEAQRRWEKLKSAYPRNEAALNHPPGDTV